MKGNIYQILNKINGKRYVGSTINIKERFLNHIYLLKSKKHHSILMQRAFDKYGIDNFEFSVLVSNIDLNSIMQEEQKEIDIKSEYNVNKKACLPPRYDKISVLYNNDGEYINTFLNLKSCCNSINTYPRYGYNKGYFVLRESDCIENILYKHFGKWGRYKKVYKYDDSSKIINSYNNINDAIKQNGDLKSGNGLITKAIKFKTKSLGFFWSYNNKENFNYIKKERWNTKKIQSINIITNESIIHESILKASKLLKIHKQTITRYLQGKTTSPTLYKFNHID